MQLSNLIERIPTSATIKMAQVARELKQQGKDIISLTLGEPDFDTPNFIKEAAKQALNDGFTKYTPVPGLLSLRQAISAKFKRDNNLDYSPEQIVVSTGAKQTLANIVLCTVNPGDDVLLPVPYWVSYAGIATMANANTIEIKTSINNDFKMTPQQLEQAITPKSKLLVFSSPCNPTGSLYSKEELQALVNVLVKHPNIIVVSDEIYEYINFTGQPHVSIASFPEIYNRVITVNGFSKGFAMTGWRLGYMGAPLAIAKACAKLQGQFTSGANAFAQKAAETALTEPLTESLKMRDAFKTRRALVKKLLSQINGLKVNMPEGAFYFFPDVSAFFGKKYGKYTINQPTDIVEYLLYEAEVATVGGEAFGDDNCIRLSYAASEEQLTEACKRIKQALDKLS